MTGRVRQAGHMKKLDVLERYGRDAAGRTLIDVAAERAEDLYSNFDRSAPYVRRDLDPDLVEYLTECARELGPEPFAIRFTLALPPDEERRGRIRRSVNSFFLYLVDVERRNIRQMMSRSLVFLLIGLAILFCALSLNQWLGEERSVVANVFAEGLIVAAWVSLWEALATFLIEWFPHRRNVALYRHLAAAELLFRAG